MRCAIIIPARYGSSRFPGKPLALIRGIPMVMWVWKAALAAKTVNRVVVATDNQQIANAVREQGGECVRVDIACRNGTERVYHAARALDLIDHEIINLQGDLPLIPPRVIDQLASVNTESGAITTTVVRLSGRSLSEFEKAKEAGAQEGVAVAMSSDGRVLYLSRSLIPYAVGARQSIFRHVGLYKYSFETLERFVNAPKNALEQMEDIELLRALENELPVRAIVGNWEGTSCCEVDRPGDLIRIESIIEGKR